MIQGIDDTTAVERRCSQCVSCSVAFDHGDTNADILRYRHASGVNVIVDEGGYGVDGDMSNKSQDGGSEKWTENSDKNSSLDLEELARYVDSETNQQDNEDSECPLIFDTLAKPDFPEKADPEFFVPNDELEMAERISASDIVPAELHQIPKTKNGNYIYRLDPAVKIVLKQLSKQAELTIRGYVKKKCIKSTITRHDLLNKLKQEEDEYIALTNCDSLTHSKLSEVDKEHDERFQVVDAISWQRINILTKGGIAYRALKSGSSISIKNLVITHSQITAQLKKNKELYSIDMIRASLDRITRECQESVDMLQNLKSKHLGKDKMIQEVQQHLSDQEHKIKQITRKMLNAIKHRNKRRNINVKALKMVKNKHK